MIFQPNTRDFPCELKKGPGGTPPGSRVIQFSCHYNSCEFKWSAKKTLFRLLPAKSIRSNNIILLMIFTRRKNNLHVWDPKTKRFNTKSTDQNFCINREGIHEGIQPCPIWTGSKLAWCIFPLRMVIWPSIQFNLIDILFFRLWLRNMIKDFMSIFDYLWS